MDQVVHKPLKSLPTTLGELERESAASGFSMIFRLRRDWESGNNRFQEEGEILFGAFRGSKLVGTAGLNRDPYLDDPSVGRLRHVYVLESERRGGIAKALVQRVLAHAAGRFRMVRLSTGRASEFYDSLSFTRMEAEHVTHVMALD